MVPIILASVVALGVSDASIAGDLPQLDFDSLTTFSFKFDPAAGQADASEASSADAIPSADAHQPFGVTGSTYWLANVGVGSDLSHDHLARVGAGISHFIADDFSIDFEFNVGGFWQDGDDAYGGNLTLLFRWHFLQDDERKWSVYADGGAGLLLTSDDVPETGSRFNFTPQVGFGASWDIGDERRLFVGGRWFHVSNSRLYENNPGQDYALFYVMLGWPF